jgi:hypothetical protein
MSALTFILLGLAAWTLGSLVLGMIVGAAATMGEPRAVDSPGRAQETRRRLRPQAPVLSPDRSRLQAPIGRW